MHSWTRAIPALPVLLAVAVTGAACGSPDEAPEMETAEVTRVDSGSIAATGAMDTAAAGTRAALPSLFTIMLGLQGDLDRISHGLWTESYDSIAAAATGVADHPRVPPEEASLIAGILGSDMARFQALDREVHDLSVQLAEQARARDLEAVLETDARLRTGCVECHTTFRERLRAGVDR